jgi:predicted ATPase/DNA-binding NarL/FixJ family response regulator
MQSRRALPVQPRPIIGRGHELRLARDLLLQADARLLTLTGPPGVGKTRLAIELANTIVGEFEDGACFVDLAPITDPRQVIDAIAHGLGLRDIDRRIGVEVVEEWLRERSLLLLVDNFEHLLDAAGLIGRVLSACPRLKVITTSRAPLHLQWERELAVPPLGLPQAIEDNRVEAVAASEAGQLFIERAQTVAPDFVLTDSDAAAVADICMALDGLPLAIELAAARIKLFPPRALVRRLAHAEKTDTDHKPAWLLLTGQDRDLPARHQTLLRALSWSYDLLSSDEQKLLRCLSVFVGGCSIDAAEVVGAHGIDGGLEILAGLVDKSLLGREEQLDGEPRLRMLETIRAYGAQQLALHHEADEVRARHARYYVELVESAAPDLFGPHQQAWFARFERERPNLLAVEAWSAQRDDHQTTVRLGAALWPFWLARDDVSHTRDRVQAILRLVDQVQPSPSLVRALHGAGLMAEKHGEYATCRSLLEQGVALARQLDDPEGLAAVLDSLGRQKFIEGRYLEARALLEESHAILRESNDRIGLARVLSHLGFLEFLEGRTEVARAIFERGLAVARAAEDQHRVAEFMDNLGNTSDAEGEFETAARCFEEAIAIWRDLGQGHWLAMALNNLGNVDVRRGDLDAARTHLLEALTLAHRIGNRRRMAYTLSAIAALAAAEGDKEQAATLQSVASAAIAQIGAAVPLRSQTVALQQFTSSTAADSRMTLDDAVEQTLAGLSAAVAPHQVEARAGSARNPTPRAAPQRGGLTRRELDVAVLVTSGCTNREIAEQLVITEGTAENYVQRILKKLGFNNRAQLAVWSIQQGLGPRPKR